MIGVGLVLGWMIGDAAANHRGSRVSAVSGGAVHIHLSLPTIANTRTQGWVWEAGATRGKQIIQMSNVSNNQQDAKIL